MKTLTIDTEDSFSSLLEFASNNDIEGFKLLLDKEGASSINEAGIWYGRQNGSKQIVLEHRTPLMVAATYGSIDVMKLILSYPEADVNFACGVNKSTALHCAASGGSVNVVDVVRLLISAGADVNCVDVNGNRPVDVIVVPPKLQGMKAVLEELLLDNASDNGSVGDFSVPVSVKSSSSGSLENGTALPYSPSVSPPSPMAELKFTEKKEYPVDPSLPDIKNSIYASDEFRMFSFKVRPCSRAYSHDWTECPFVHPGENARRRDPRKFHYSCVPCPEFRKGTCRRGDMCEYAHGVFECWLHPAQYRTRLCKDGISCNRRVCFFAHIPEELRPLYASTGSAVPSPRSSATALNAMDMAAAMNLFPGSPSSVSSMSPSHFSQPMSPSGNSISFSNASWAQQNVPALHLPGSNLQSSRLRSSLSARDIPLEDFNVLTDFDGQQHLFNDLSCLSQPGPGSCRSKTLTPSNLEELFSAEILSTPRYSDQAMASVFSPSHKSAAMNQFKQLQSMLSPINTNMLSPKNVDHPLLQASFGVPSSGRMSPRSVEPISPMSPRMSAFVQREKQQQQLRSISSRDLGANNPTSVVGSPTNPWSKWGSPNGMADWSVNGDELSRQMRSASSFEHTNNGEEPDLSWVQTLVKDSSPEIIKEKFASSGPIASADGLNSNSQIESVDHSVLGAWLEQMKLDQLVV
ncbi:zinc finger CCCH domain-containing protein 30-like [Cicer arietinum]|uniref:Zinc finger CCCH domain-containing protein 30-like n=1 Tax=Cicer arietinum TaxID=3827 RepID=A0A1S2YWC5_CICAR|nr:zinc finger CCCH domain-containing protein 30-like [Cicer arietinum]